MTINAIVQLIVEVVNAISILILLVGVIKATFSFISIEMGLIRDNNTKSRDPLELNRIKNYLGSYVLLSLEVLIAADIIESIINPTLEDLLMLAGVVVIRTTISHFLGKEIEETKVD